VAIELTNAPGVVKPRNGQQELVSIEALCYRIALLQGRVATKPSLEYIEITAKI